MPRYVVCQKRPNQPLREGKVIFVEAPTPAEAALASGIRSPDVARVLALNQSKDITVVDTQTFAADDGTTVVTKTREEVEAIKAADAGF